MFLLDVNKDGILDVVTFVRAARQAKPRRPGDGRRFGFGGFTGGQITNGTFDIHNALLGVGDVDADGNLDAVDTDGVLLSSTSLHIPNAAPFTYARVGDINNGDGRPDVVGTFCASASMSTSERVGRR